MGLKQVVCFDPVKINIAAILYIWVPEHTPTNPYCSTKTLNANFSFVSFCCTTLSKYSIYIFSKASLILGTQLDFNVIFRSTEHSLSSWVLAGDLEYFTSVIWALHVLDWVVKMQVQGSLGPTIASVSSAVIQRWPSLNNYYIGLYSSPMFMSIKRLGAAKLFC